MITSSQFCHTQIIGALVTWTRQKDGIDVKSRSSDWFEISHNFLRYCKLQLQQFYYLKKPILSQCKHKIGLITVPTLAGRTPSDTICLFTNDLSRYRMRDLVNLVGKLLTVILQMCTFATGGLSILRCRWERSIERSSFGRQLQKIHHLRQMLGG